MNTTLKELSQSLGLSVSTVSRALKDHPDISAATKRRVRELATVLDYEPNMNAINLRARSNPVFGLMVPSISNTFYASFMAAVEDGARAMGYSVILMQSGDDTAREEKILKLFWQNRTAGIFACLSPETKDFNTYEKLRELSTPVIFFDKVPALEGANRVTIDEEKAAQLAATNLESKDFKNVFCLWGNEQLSITKVRREAFHAAIRKDDSLTIEESFANSSLEAEKELTKALKIGQPEAVFCMSDEILTGVMKALQAAGLAVPASVYVLAMSDGFYPTLYHPQIPYVETSGYKLGVEALKLMQECLAEKKTGLARVAEPVLVLS